MPSRNGSAEVASAQRPHESLITQIQGQAHLESQLGASAAEVMANVTDKIATAETLDEIFAAANDAPGKIENYVGSVLRIQSFSYLKSDSKYEGPIGVYAVIVAITEQNEEVTVSTGATNIVTMLKRFEQLGLIDPENGVELAVRVKSRETGSGTLYTFDKP